MELYECKRHVHWLDALEGLLPRTVSRCIATILARAWEMRDYGHGKPTYQAKELQIQTITSKEGACTSGLRYQQIFVAGETLHLESKMVSF